MLYYSFSALSWKSRLCLWSCYISTSNLVISSSAAFPGLTFLRTCLSAAAAASPLFLFRMFPARFAVIGGNLCKTAYDPTFQHHRWRGLTIDSNMRCKKHPCHSVWALDESLERSKQLSWCANRPVVIYSFPLSKLQGHFPYDACHYTPYIV